MKAKALGFYRRCGVFPCDGTAMGKPLVSGKVPERICWRQHGMGTVDLERCGLQRDWPGLYTDPGFGASPGDGKQIVHHAADGGPSSGTRDVLMRQPLLDIFLLVPVFPVPTISFIGELVLSVQGHQPAGKLRQKPRAGSKLCLRRGAAFGGAN